MKIFKIILFLVGFLGTAQPTLALWDGNPYKAGTTLNPECTPDQTDCAVAHVPIEINANTIPWLKIDEAGTITFSGNLVPSAGSTFDIGSIEHPVRELFVSKDSITVDGTRLSNSGGVLNWGGYAFQMTPTAADTSQIRFTELTANGSQYVTLKAPDAIAGNITLILPSTAGTNGQFLSTNGSGTLSWATPLTAAITSLNGLTSASQTFGNDMNVTISSLGSSHILGWTGQLGVGRGGTGVGTLTGVLKGNGAGAFTAMTGTTNYTARWTDANTLGTGTIYDNGASVGIGTADVASGSRLTSKLDVSPSLTDGAVALRLENAVDGSGAPGQPGAQITFAQRWWSGSYDLIRVGAIRGYKTGADGSFGGGLQFLTQRGAAANMDVDMSLSDGNLSVAGSISGINGVPYGWPSAQGGANSILRNNGAGALSWSSPSSLGSITLATGTTGTDANVSGSPASLGGTITLNLPSASATNRGLLTSTDWSTFNNKLGNSLGNGLLWIGNASNIPTAVSLSGDATISNTGVLTIGANTVALTTDTTGNYVSDITAGTGITKSGTAGEGWSPTISVSGSVPTAVTSDTNVTGSLASNTLTLGWTGQLAVGRGGTNSTATPTAGGISFGTGTAFNFTAAGTTGQVLTSQGAGAPVWAAVAACATCFINNGNSFGTTAVLGTNENQALAFETVGTNRMTIGTNGSVSIGGSTEATSKLYVDINANDYVATFNNHRNQAGSNGIKIIGGSTVAYPSFYADFVRADGWEIGAIRQTDYATLNYTNNSDLRLKENIIDSASGLEVLNKIKVRDFNFLGDPAKTKMQGFIAQELFQNYPQAVSVGGDDVRTNPWGVDYGKLTPLLVKSVQELAGRTQALTFINGEIEALEVLSDKYSDLEGRVSDLQKIINTGILQDLRDSGAIVFTGDVTFKGRVAYEDKDTAGYARIKKGTNEVRIVYQNAYYSEPVITVTILEPEASVTVVDRSSRGFTIRLSQPAAADTLFSWHAVLVNNPLTSESSDALSPTPTPTATPTPTEVSISPTPSIEPSPTPTEVSISPTPEIEEQVSPPASPSADSAQ